MTTRRDAAAADQQDPLAVHREQFRIDPGVVYLDGNSLGALPVRVEGRVAEVIAEQWGRDLIRSWNKHGWADLPRTVGDKIGSIIGAEPDSVIAADSTTVNLYKAVHAALSMTPRPRILTDAGNFPTDIYAMSGVAEQLGRELVIVEPEEVLSSVDDSVGVLALTQVDYRTGRKHDLANVTKAAQESGALMVWDLAHSAGAFPVDVAAHGVDLAVGCGYKYLNGGPGAPGFIYVAPRHQARFANPIRGWWGHTEPFAFRLDFTPADGIDRARVGTPHVLSMLVLDAALDVFADIDLRLVEAKSRRLSSLFIDLLDSRVELASPAHASQRGSQVSVRHPDAYAVVQALIGRGVIGDFRMPDIARFGFAPLYVRYVDAWDAADQLRAVLDAEEWAAPEHRRRAQVT